VTEENLLTFCKIIELLQHMYRNMLFCICDMICGSRTTQAKFFF